MKHTTSRVGFIVNTLSVVFATLVFVATTVFSLPALAAALPEHPAILAVGGLFSFAGDRPTELGVTNGLLTPCPTSPNCVSSQSRDSKHRIDPLEFDGTATDAIQQLKAIITNLPRTTIVETTDNYLYAEFASALMGFVDDVEFYIEPATQEIQVRSASRLGESDLGVNRKRIEAIRKKLNGLDLAL